MKTNCVSCNKEMNLKPFHFKRYKGPFSCSRECRGEFLKTAYKGPVNPNFKHKNDVHKLFLIKASDIKRRSKSKKIPYNLDADFLYELYLEQNGLCHYSGIPMALTTTNFLEKGQADIDVMSVDKIEPEKGYIRGNVVLCCNGINKLKGSANPEQLQSLISAIGLSSFGTCKIKFKITREGGQAPFRAKLGDGGHDLAAAHVEDLGDKIKVHTGVAIEPSFGWILLALPRSSIVKKGVILSNCVGLIDNQYRGEILAIFNKLNPNAKIEIGERVIQLLPIRIPKITIEEVDELSETERGTGGFGSTGQ